MEVGHIYRHNLLDDIQLNTGIIHNGYHYLLITDVTKVTWLGLEEGQCIGIDLKTFETRRINQQYWNSWEKM